MRLVRIKEAAEAAYVTGSMICHWVRTDRLVKYPIAGYKNRYEVDLDEVLRVSRVDKFQEKCVGNLITPTEAASLLYVGTRMISYYVKRGYIKPHYVFGNNKHYLVDREEILAQPALILERSRHTHRIEELKKQEREQPRDSRGHWAKRTTVA
jgi:DNA-binding transcriptional MerR regulator